MPFTITCSKCGYKVTGGDDNTGRNFIVTKNKFPEMLVCEFCGGEPVVTMISVKEYAQLYKGLKVRKGTLIFVVAPPNWSKVDDSRMVKIISEMEMI